MQIVQILEKTVSPGEFSFKSSGIPHPQKSHLESGPGEDLDHGRPLGPSLRRFLPGFVGGARIIEQKTLKLRLAHICGETGSKVCVATDSGMMEERNKRKRGWRFVQEEARKQNSRGVRAKWILMKYVVIVDGQWVRSLEEVAKLISTSNVWKIVVGVLSWVLKYLHECN